MRLLLVLLTCVISIVGYKRICYYTNWSQYRLTGQKFYPENVDTSLCTHLIYAFSTMTGNRIRMFEWNDNAMYTRFRALKHRNPKLKTLLAVGGRNFGTSRMTDMLSTFQNRQEFANTSISFLRRYGFDGLDLDFEYPGRRGSPASDKGRYSELCQQLRVSFDAEAVISGRPRLLLTAAVAAEVDDIDAAYDVPSIVSAHQFISNYITTPTSHFDWLSLMAYDLHGSWDNFTGHHTALYARANESSLEYAAKYWVSKGCPKDKLIIGLASYGRTFTLSDPSNNTIGVPTNGPGTAGRYTGEYGFVSYYEVCKYFNTASSVHVWNEEQQVPYVYKNKEWVGYDNLRSIEIKTKWLMAEGFAGFMMWSLDLDDFNGNMCGEGKYPLLKRINDVLDGVVFTTPAPVTDANGNIVTTTKAPTTTTTTTTTVPPTFDPSLNDYGGGGLDFSCDTKPNGVYVYTHKCGAFWACKHNKRFYYDCPVGLSFNPLELYCDWPRNVPKDVKCVK